MWKSIRTERWIVAIDFLYHQIAVFREWNSPFSFFWFLGLTHSLFRTSSGGCSLWHDERIFCEKSAGWLREEQKRLFLQDIACPHFFFRVSCLNSHRNWMCTEAPQTGKSICGHCKTNKRGTVYVCCKTVFISRLEGLSSLSFSELKLLQKNTFLLKVLFNKDVLC